ncbi:MAG TPA: hypothetical protein VN516_09480 [Candidatus Baltobacteraceae bacterium]|nr:hypothetical protein [Candidatus Baltobacteraceae bacterium]
MNDTDNFWGSFGSLVTTPTSAPQTSGGFWQSLLGDATQAYTASQQPAVTAAAQPAGISTDKFTSFITSNLKLIIIGVVAVGVLIAGVMLIRRR